MFGLRAGHASVRSGWDKDCGRWLYFGECFTSRSEDRSVSGTMDAVGPSVNCDCIKMLTKWSSIDPS